MTNKHKKVPELRFKGFTDDWEQRKLSDLMTFSNGINAPKENYGTGTKMISVMDILNPLPMKYDNILNSVAVDKKNEDKNKVEKGDLIFVRSSEIVEEVGWAKAYKEDRYALYSGFAIRGKRISSYNTYFIELTLNYANRKEIKRRAGGSTRFNVSQEILNSLNVLTPSISEQNQIDLFFTKIDDTIALHQRKLDLLKEQKKGFLQRMFPKNGETVPELRFEGFADAWEQCELKDVANHRGGTAIEKHFDESGKYKVISIGSYGLDSQYVDQGIRAVSNEVTDNRVVRKGELTMVLNDKTANGTIIGRSLLIDTDDEFVINQRTEIVSPKENLDSSFAYVLLNGPFREKVKQIVQGGTQIYVNYPAVEKLILELPTLDEQKKIGQFFSTLDHLITLHQRKLELLKEQKKGFLQKMFV